MRNIDKLLKDRKAEVVVAENNGKQLIAIIDLDRDSVEWRVLYGDGYYAEFTDKEKLMKFFCEG